MNPDCICVILCGDFNHRDVEWTQANNIIGLMPHSWTNPQSELCVCVEMFCEYGLLQCNEDHTCNEHTLDLVCVHGGHCNVLKTEMAIKSTHDALHCELLCARRPNQEHAERFVYNYRKADFTHLLHIHLLRCSPLSLLTDTTGVDEGFQIFSDFVYAAINKCVPRIFIRGRKYSTWYDNDMISSLKEKDNEGKALKRSHSLTDYQVFF